MQNIGFSTGSLHRSKISFEERIKLYHSLGADAIELGFATPDKLLDCQLSKQTIADISKFEFVSVHAPWKEVKYDNSLATQKIIEKLRSLSKQISIEGFVVHPDTIDNFEILDQSDLPFLLENMDKRKSYGTTPEQFRDLKRKYNFGFVLDIQHAYEHDPSMQLGKELVDIMGDKLKHMHVSGHNEQEIHVPTYSAVNKEAITELLKLDIDVPKILEGILLEDVENSIKNELAYVKDYKRNR